VTRAIAAAIAAVAAGTSLATQPASLTNSVGMELVLIPPGSMIVGRFEPPYPTPPDPNAPPAPEGRRGRGPGYTPEQYARFERLAKAAARPGFTVRLPRAFYIGKYEVTQAQWKAVMHANPSTFQADKVGDAADRHPVDTVTWDDAQAFIRRLNALEKTSAYRLPTEFEWEYAARAGEDADTPWAVTRERAVAGYNRYFTTQPVGSRKPNAWELYDMQGNVWEWVQDYYNEKLFADPVPPRRGRVRVLKGGGFAADVKNAIPATHAAGPGSRFDVGFRVVRDVR
jgi:formylglycine-generating enzyme